MELCGEGFVNVLNDGESGDPLKPELKKVWRFSTEREGLSLLKFGGRNSAKEAFRFLKFMNKSEKDETERRSNND